MPIYSLKTKKPVCPITTHPCLLIGCAWYVEDLDACAVVAINDHLRTLYLEQVQPEEERNE